MIPTIQHTAAAPAQGWMLAVLPDITLVMPAAFAFDPTCSADLDDRGVVRLVGQEFGPGLSP